jgi:hypothetical protein
MHRCAVWWGAAHPLVSWRVHRLQGFAAPPSGLFAASGVRDVAGPAALCCVLVRPGRLPHVCVQQCSAVQPVWHPVGAAWCHQQRPGPMLLFSTSQLDVGQFRGLICRSMAMPSWQACCYWPAAAGMAGAAGCAVHQQRVAAVHHGLHLLTGYTTCVLLEGKPSTGHRVSHTQAVGRSACIFERCVAFSAPAPAAQLSSYMRDVDKRVAAVIRALHTGIRTCC